MCGVCSFSLPSCWAGSSLLCLITYNNGKTRAEQERHEHEASLSYDDGPTRTLRLPGLLMHIHPVHLHLFSLP